MKELDQTQLQYVNKYNYYTCFWQGLQTHSMRWRWRERERHMSAHMFLVDFDGIDGRMALMHSDCLCFRLAND